MITNQYPFPGRGNMQIDSDPLGATVYVDGYALQDKNNQILTTPAMVVDAMDGIHEIQISLDGYYSKKIFLDVVPGKVIKAFAKLIPIY